MEALGEPEVTQTVHAPLLKQLLHCVDGIVKTAGPLCSQHSEAIFIILLRLQAASGDQQSRVEEVSVSVCTRAVTYILLRFFHVVCWVCESESVHECVYRCVCVRVCLCMCACITVRDS